MNNYQKVVVIVAALNLGLMLLFPPTLDTPLARATLPSFAGFQPFFALGGGQRIFEGLLAIECLFVGANALAAWLALSRAAVQPPTPQRLALGIGLFAAANLALMLLFPPFETYSGLLKNPLATFDGFYLAFGERSRRAVFAPILYLELVLLAVNVLGFWLLLGLVGGASRGGSQAILDLARDLPPEEAVKLSEQMLRQAVSRGRRKGGGSGADRRRDDDPDPPGGERRHGSDRRHRPR